MHDSYFLPLIKTFKNLVHFFGVEVVRHNFYHSGDKLLESVLRYYGVNTILDVGANIGQYAKEAIRHGYKGEIHSFEPIPEVFEQLASKARGHSKWKVYPLGVGSKEEDILMNISENLVSSSVLKVGEASLSAESSTRIVRQQKIKVTTLDLFIHDRDLKGEILLKLDIQGYEMEALRGALKSLPSIKLIQAELSFTQLYEGGPLFDEVIGFLKEHAYEVFAIVPGFRDDRSGRMLQADGIFVKKG